jgi:hypothetical protein
MVTRSGKRPGQVLMTARLGRVLCADQGRAANPRGDIWWGGTGDPQKQRPGGLTEEYKSPKLSELQPWAVRQAEQSKYRTVGVYAGALGFSYNAEQMKKNRVAEPKCWADLTKPIYKDEIQVANPNSSGTSYTMLATLVQLMGEDKAFDYLKACTRTSTSTRSRVRRRRDRLPSAADRHHVPARCGRPCCRRRAGRRVPGKADTRSQHEHHQGREEHGERQSGTTGRSLPKRKHRRAGESVYQVPSNKNATRRRRRRSSRDQVHQLRLREARIVGGAHAPADEVGQGSSTLPK